MFQNECVGHMSYEATAPAISMAAAMVTFILDFVGSRIAHKKYSGHPLESPSINDSGESGSEERKGLQDASHPAHHDSHGHNFDAALAAEQNHQVLLLEAGIIFHSIMIGVTLVSCHTMICVVVDGTGCRFRTRMDYFVHRYHLPPDVRRSSVSTCHAIEGKLLIRLRLGARIAVVRAIGKMKAIIMAMAFTVSRCLIPVAMLADARLADHTYVSIYTHK
jgi:hypothetical protein